ncbi:alpha/beta hydrolase [Hymenobacter armeniacus]|uniref:Alpha/beta hydrolase n=1 Tax=Hymenobacter armeniacus TaxID=2771358 RepID=A0ABR8JST2_9BACT|nr:alpha/beta hydrolase [Hymenobacter armeniacus]MBD2722150.1 alpha/beta hydrolase [Hymenobacter armeniacus]
MIVRRIIGRLSLLALLGGWPATQAMAQQVPVPRDTSFTVHSAFAKALKTNPGISIARPAAPATIEARLNQTYCTLGSRALQLDVFYPKARRKRGYPAVLFIHGGGWRSGDRSQHVAMAQQLAARGYVTATAEYRLSTEALYPAAVHDLKAAIRWLRANATAYHIDTAKVAVWGFSAGGQLAALLGTTNGDPQLEGTACHTRYSSRVQAIVDVDGTLAFIHPESGEGDDRKGTSAATYWFGAPKTEKPELWLQAGALSHVTAQTPPILFLNSSVARMHAGRDDMRRQLDAFHIYHETHAFPDAPHPFPLFNPWFDPTLDYTAAFLKRVFN